MKNNLRLYLMSALCCVALTNEPGYSITQQEISDTIQAINTIQQKPEQYHLAGLNNFACTCYMNATLQALANQGVPMKALLQTYYNRIQLSGLQNSKLQLTTEWVKLLQYQYRGNSLDGNTTYSYSPIFFKQCIDKLTPEFQAIQAHDAKDLIVFILEQVHAELHTPLNTCFWSKNKVVNSLDEKEMLSYFANQYARDYNSPISNHFYGIMKMETTCCSCQTKQSNFQVYSVLDLSLGPILNSLSNSNIASSYGNQINWIPCVMLKQCFDYISKASLMKGNNQLYCKICKAPHDCLTGTRLYSSPKTLILHLNRGKDAIHKCNVAFPTNLDMNNYTIYQDRNSQYYLSAIIVHRGPSGNSGHFVAYCRSSEKPNSWYLYNDDVVTKISDNTINEITRGNPQNEMPYVLFYTKCSQNTNLNKNNYNIQQTTNLQNSINNNQQNYSNNNVINNQINQKNINILHDFSNINQVSITTNINDIEKYINYNSRNRINNKINDDRFLISQFMNKYYSGQMRSSDSIENVLNTVLRSTIVFLQKYSWQNNQDTCNRFGKAWLQIYQDISMRNDCNRFKPFVNAICKQLLPKYSININNVKEEPSTINSFPE